MKFSDILKDLRNGCKVRRSSWGERLWVEENTPNDRGPKFLRLYTTDDDGGKRLLDVDTRLTYEDILADDWVVYLMFNK